MFKRRRDFGLSFGFFMGHRWAILFFASVLFSSMLVCGQENSPAKAPSAKALLEVERLVTVQNGEIPIILSAPHGGTRRIPGVRRPRLVSERRAFSSARRSRDARVGRVGRRGFGG